MSYMAVSQCQCPAMEGLRFGSPRSQRRCKEREGRILGCSYQGLPESITIISPNSNMRLVWGVLSHRVRHSATYRLFQHLPL